MLFTQSHTEQIHFTSTLCKALQRLHRHNYFSYLLEAHKLRHWGLINHQHQLTLKGLSFLQGKISIAKSIVVSPRFSNDPDPEIVRSDSFVFMEVERGIQ
jgi:hypothetical protein